MEFVATTFKNLEPLLEQELKDLGIFVARTQSRAVVCKGEKKDLYRALYNSFLSLRILVPVEKFKIRFEDQLYKEARNIRWEKYLSADSSFAIHASVHSKLFNHTKYPVYRLKDAICDYFDTKYGHRPDVNLENPDMTFHLRISERHITISLDASGEPLYKRGYKTAGAQAPMNEVLATALIKASKWKSGAFLDPMCGSGTLLTEAFLINMEYPAQYFREDLAIFKWKSFDLDIWEEVRSQNEPSSKTSGKFYGLELDPRAVDATIQNIKALNADQYFDIRLNDFFRSSAPESSGTIIMNPPYDERMPIEDACSFYRRIGDHLKEAYKGWNIWIFTANYEALRKIGMKPSKKHIFYNGPLECRFHLYEVFA
jgi:putative N6-adenine-specific DNA methylase